MPTRLLAHNVRHQFTNSDILVAFLRHTESTVIPPQHTLNVLYNRSSEPFRYSSYEISIRPRRFNRRAAVKVMEFDYGLIYARWWDEGKTPAQVLAGVVMGLFHPFPAVTKGA